MNSKGFTFVESLVASSLLLMMVTTLIPIADLIVTERSSMNQQRIFQNELHDELQHYLWEEPSKTPLIYDKELDPATLTFIFSMEENLLKGCAEWTDVKKKNKQTCLYGYPNKQ